MRKRPIVKLCALAVTAAIVYIVLYSKPFDQIEKKYGIHVHYQKDELVIGEDDPPDLVIQPIRKNETDRLPKILSKSLGKYPDWVIKEYLEHIWFVEDLSMEEKDAIVGLASPRKKIIYVEVAENGISRTDTSVEETIHHELAHILDEKFSFPEVDWRNCNPEGFVYGKKEDEPEKYLWEKGFVSNYARSDAAEDFPELTGLIFSQPRKAKLLIDHFPIIQAKYRLWLKFFQQIDADYFNEIHFFPPNLYSAIQTNKVKETELIEIHNMQYHLGTGLAFSGKSIREFTNKTNQNKEVLEQRVQTEYQDGKKISKKVFFYKKNILDQIQISQNDKKVSTTSFHPNGKKSQETDYEDDKKKSTTFWDDKGLLDQTILYKNDKKVSTTSFHPNGKKSQETDYEDDKEKSTTFWDNKGLLDQTILYKNDEEIVTSFYPNGQKKYEAVHKNGNTAKETIKRWNPDGTLK